MREIATIITLSIFLLSGCHNGQSHSEELLDEAERVIEVNPDSASSILQKISSPEEMNDKTFARWCMLSGKVTDKIFNAILPTYQLERAYEWFSSHGSPEEQTQILIYLGRSNATDGDYDKAMSIYINALEVAEKNKLNNLCGYIHCYIGDLYSEKAMREQAIDKYQIAMSYFRNESNIDSYAYTLRDIGREYACMDSLMYALKYLSMADSIAANSQSTHIKASVANALGNIYIMQERYDKGQEYLSKALALGGNQIPNYIALIDLNIASGSIQKAKELLQELLQNDSTYTYSIRYLLYQIHKSEKNYKEALTNLEEYTNSTDSAMNADSQSKLLNIEAKYNHLKIKQEVNNLKIKQQSYIIALVICTSGLLLFIAGYLLYRKRVKEKIQKQQDELNNIKIKMLNLSLELEKKRSLLSSLKEKDEKYKKMQEEINILSTIYKKAQKKLLLDSPIYKELAYLVSQNKPGNNKPLITKQQWQLTVNEITTVYPDLYHYIQTLCPDLPEQDFQYCCFYMYGFDTNAEAKLLNISPNSTRTKHLRLRQKLNISLPPNSTLYDYLIENMHRYL